MLSTCTDTRPCADNRQVGAHHLAAPQLCQPPRSEPPAPPASGCPPCACACTAGTPSAAGRTPVSASAMVPRQPAALPEPAGGRCLTDCTNSCTAGLCFGSCAHTNTHCEHAGRQVRNSTGYMLQQSAGFTAAASHPPPRLRKVPHFWPQACPHLQALDGLPQLAHHLDALGSLILLRSHALLQDFGQLLSHASSLGRNLPEGALQAEVQKSSCAACVLVAVLASRCSTGPKPCPQRQLPPAEGCPAGRQVCR